MLAVLLSASVILPLGFSGSISKAEEVSDDCLSSETAWMGADGTYDYPIDVLDDEWKEFTSVVEMREVTQIPDEVLSSISTKELISLIIDYPLLSEINAFDTLEDGYAHLKENFNGIQEIVTREDAFEELLAAYENYTIITDRMIDYEEICTHDDYVDEINAMMQDDYYRALILEDGLVLETVNILEMLLTDVLESDGDEAQIEAFVEAYVSKLDQKNDSAYYDNYNPLELMDALERNDSELLNAFGSGTKYGTDQTVTYVTIYTPSGYSVQVKYSSDYESVDLSLWMSLIEANNATLYSQSYTTYNCHSYAWLKDWYSDSYRHMWMNSASKFASDSAYTKKTLSTAVKGTIVYYGDHSAVATGSSTQNQTGGMELYVISKWGTGPLVKHTEHNCPYYQSQTLEYYYRG